MKKYLVYEKAFSFIIIIVLALIALDIIFATSGGLFTMFQGLSLTLYVFMIIALLMIYIRITELKK